MDEVVLHQVDAVSHSQILPASADDQYGGNSAGRVQFAYAVSKRGNGLPLYQFLHHPITDHEIGSASVLVDE